MRLHDFLYHQSLKCLYKKTFVVSSTIPKASKRPANPFKGTSDVWEMTATPWTWHMPDVCTGSYMLFSVVTHVVGMCGEDSEGFLSGKHYILLNHVFIPD